MRDSLSIPSEKMHFVRINFDENPSYKLIFDGDSDIDTLIKQITLRVPAARLVPGRTLIFLDEIQNCPTARTALKFLSIDGRFDVVASGSLLGINYKEVPSFPVGYVEHLEMHSLDFEEFLWVNGVTMESVGDIRVRFERREEVPPAMHKTMMERLKEHIVVGGMPRVVDALVRTHDFTQVLRLQKASSRIISTSSRNMLQAPKRPSPGLASCPCSSICQRTTRNASTASSRVDDLPESSRVA